MHMNAMRKPNSSDRLKKIQLACYVEPDQAAALKALSVKTRVPQQVYLREGIEHVLAKYKKELRS
jgi:Ribbon-helix-helix domain